MEEESVHSKQTTSKEEENTNTKETEKKETKEVVNPPEEEHKRIKKETNDGMIQDFEEHEK